MSSALQIAYIIVSVLIIILVLSQKSKDNGFSTITGASSTGRETGKSFEKKLQLWTTCLIVVYIIFSVVFNFFYLKDTKNTETVFGNVYNTENVDDANAETDNVEAQTENVNE